MVLGVGLQEDVYCPPDVLSSDQDRTLHLDRADISGHATRTSAQKWLLRVGSIGPLGHLPASGTVSVAVAGIPLAWLMRTTMSIWLYLAIVIAFTGFAVWLHDAGDRLLGEKDSRKLVLDELAGFFVAVMVVPWTWPMVTLAFFLERGIDIIKVPPANWIEKRIPGGLGVVGDDIVAGLYTMLILLLIEHYVPAQLWGG